MNLSKRKQLSIVITFVTGAIILWLYQIDQVSVIKNRIYLRTVNDNPPILSLLSAKQELEYPEFMDFNTLPDNDEQRLINLTEFKFIINQPPCTSDTKYLLLLHAALKNRDRRKAVRETWGCPDPRTRVFFFFGLQESEEAQMELEQENVIHGDIIQGNFLDSYHNLTYKHIMLMKWAIYYCPQVQYIIKADDDILINTPYLYDYFDTFNHTLLNDKLFCQASHRQPILRRKASKWYVSEDEFPGEYYPTYCSGYTIVYPMMSAFKIYQVAQRQSNITLWVDDAYVAGVLRDLANLTVVNWDSYPHVKLNEKGLKELEKLENIDENLKFAFTIQGPKPNQIRLVWKLITSKYDGTLKQFTA